MTEAAVLPGVTQQNLKRQCLKENVADGAEHRERHPERIGCLEETENIEVSNNTNQNNEDITRPWYKNIGSYMLI